MQMNSLNRKRLPAFGVVLTLAALSADLSWGTVTSCNTTAGGAALSTYGTQSTANGCAEVDKSFTDFGVSSSGFGTPSTSSNVLLSLAGSSLTSSAGLATLNFFGGNNWKGPGDATVNYVVQTHPSGQTFNGYTYTPGVDGFVAPSTGNWALNSITADLAASRLSLGGNGDSIILREGFCLGDSTLSTTGACNTTNGSNFGFIQVTETKVGGSATYTYICQGLGGVVVAGCNSGGFTVSATPGIVNFSFGNQTAASIFNTISLASGASVQINGGFGNNFGEIADVPEPSTVVVTGLALFGFGLLSYRRKLRANS